MKRSELKKIIREEIQSILHEESNIQLNYIFRRPRGANTYDKFVEIVVGTKKDASNRCIELEESENGDFKFEFMSRKDALKTNDKKMNFTFHIKTAESRLPTKYKKFLEEGIQNSKDWYEGKWKSLTDSQRHIIMRNVFGNYEVGSSILTSVAVAAIPLRMNILSPYIDKIYRKLDGIS